MGHVRIKRLREKFPKLAAEYPHEFRVFFNSDGEMTKLGQDVNQMIKREHRLRTTSKKEIS